MAKKKVILMRNDETGAIVPIVENLREIYRKREYSVADSKAIDNEVNLRSLENENVELRNEVANLKRLIVDSKVEDGKPVEPKKADKK